MEQPLRRVVLDDAIGRFLDHRRALGRGYATEEHILRGVRNFILELGADDLDQKTFECWSAPTASLSPNTRRARQRTVRLLCLHRRRTEPECFVPDPLHFARPQPYRPPVLVQPEQVARMLACATSAAPTPNSPLRGAVLRLAVVLLYTAGLRRGEVTGLTLGDVDAEAGVVRVRESKFHKSRLVPLSTDAGRELRRYLRTRGTGVRRRGGRRRRSSATVRGAGAATPGPVCATPSRGCSTTPASTTAAAGVRACTTFVTASLFRR